MLRLAEDDRARARFVIGACVRCTGFLLSRAPPTIWCACETWPPQFRRCKSRRKCARRSVQSASGPAKTPKIKLFDIAKDEK